MEKDQKASRGGFEQHDSEILLRRLSLRTNVARRVSQVCRDEAPTEETTCGIGCIRGQWLQSFANRNSYTFIYGILGSVYGSYCAYFFGVMTTLEKRFNISCQRLGIIASAGDITRIITCFILSLCVSTVHRPRLIGIGVLIIVASTVIFNLPHFLYEPTKTWRISSQDYFTYLKNETGITRCAEETRTCVNDLKEENGPIIFFFLAQSLQGIGGSLYFLAGESYKNDNIEKHQQPALLSLLSVLNILGPAFGYWLSSVSLKNYHYPGLILQVTEDKPHWIGAWWLGSPIIGFILITPGFLVSLFPKALQKAAARKTQLKSVQEISRNVAEEKHEIAAFKKLFINQNFNFTQFAPIFNIMGFVAYFIFLPKYVESQYRVSASKANLMAGAVALIFSAIGIVTANSVITRYRPSARALASWTLIVDILSIGGLLSNFYLECQANNNEIITVVAPNLNTTCKCVNSPFFPICDEYGRSYISPCHAGCENTFHINNTQGYAVCNQISHFSNSRNVFSGFCPVDCHSNFLKFIIITCSVTFVYATGRTSNYWFDTKLKGRTTKLSILNSVMSVFGLLVLISAPISFGYLFDKSCLLWAGNCNHTGNCLLYDNEKLKISMNLGAVGFAFAGIILDFGVWYSVRNLTLFDEDYYGDESNE